MQWQKGAKMPDCGSVSLQDNMRLSKYEAKILTLACWGLAWGMFCMLCAAIDKKPSSVWGWVVRRPGVFLWLCRRASLPSGTDHPVTPAQTENSGGTEMFLPVWHHHGPKNNICHESFVYALLKSRLAFAGARPWYLCAFGCGDMVGPEFVLGNV